MADADEGFVERLWYGDGALASASRAVLMPAERVFRGLVGARDILYDAGWLPTHDTTIPAISVGNLTVGGSGKTPIAAWIAQGLASRGLKPAIVLRGYGADEPLVHKQLNPDVPVVTNADRVAAVTEAGRLGAEIAVLDDAFQHRRVRRIADLVLVSADQWTPDVHLLPAGPWREPLKAIRRATLVVVTRKAADAKVVESVHQRLSQIAPLIPRVSVRFDLGELTDARDASVTRPLSGLSGATVRAILSIANPGAFIRQLEQAGARVHASVYPDHHNFSESEVAKITSERDGIDWFVCTLKDAVKLGPRWPRLAPSLWYVSQHVMVERGVGGIERLLDDVARARQKTPSTAG
jgi:tetraacyldisaccharide 4'-kinase